MFWDSCLHLIPVASHPQGVFGVPSRQKQMSETGVNAICGQVPDRVPFNEVKSVFNVLSNKQNLHVAVKKTTKTSPAQACSRPGILQWSSHVSPAPASIPCFTLCSSLLLYGLWLPGGQETDKEYCSLTWWIFTLTRYFYVFLRNSESLTGSLPVHVPTQRR